MRAMKIAVRLIAPVAVFALAGCFGLGRGAPVQRHYVLGLGLAQTGSRPVEVIHAGPGPRIGMRVLRLAQYLDTPLIVVRRGEHQIVLSEFHRWGEPLAHGVNRSVAGYLSALSPDLRVESAPWSSRVRHDYVIQLQILSFEGWAPDDLTATVGEARVLATWEIARGDDGAMLARGTTAYRGEGWEVGEYDALLTLLEAGLNRLAGDLVAALEGVRRPPTAAPSRPPGSPAPAPG